MIASILLPILLAAIPSASAHSESTIAHFNSSLILGSITFPFSPETELSVTYPGASPLSEGQVFPNTDGVQLQPSVSVPVQGEGKYAIAMVDYDVAGTTTLNPNRHWMVTGIQAAGPNASLAISNGTEAGVIVSYKAPGPPAGTGPHRYAFILFSQPEAFVDAPFSESANSVSPFDLNAFVATNNFTVVAATYMTVSQGDGAVTVSVASTSPVDSAAITEPASSGSASASASASGSSSRASSASSSRASTTSSQPASAANVKLSAALLAACAFGAALII